MSQNNLVLSHSATVAMQTTFLVDEKHSLVRRKRKTSQRGKERRRKIERKEDRRERRRLRRRRRERIRKVRESWVTCQKFCCFCRM